MLLLSELERKCETPPVWEEVFATIIVANSISTDPQEIRGIVTLCIGTNELRSSYFGDICQDVREYENLPEFKVNPNIGVRQGLQQFFDKMPENMTLLGTNVSGWLKPMLNAANEEFGLFKGHSVDFIDLGCFATPQKVTQIHQERDMRRALPQNRYNGRAGSLNRLGELVSVDSRQFKDAIHAERRARALAEILRRNLEREIEDV